MIDARAGVTMAMALLATTAATATAGCKQRGPHAQSTSYTFPVPEGWEHVSTDKLQADVALRRKGGGASIVVEPTSVVATLLDPTDGASCRRVADGVVKKLKDSTLLSAVIVEGPTGRTCQYELSYGKNYTRTTFLKGPKDAWLFACTRLPGDDESLVSCERALRGWKFAP